MNNQILGIFQ